MKSKVKQLIIFVTIASGLSVEYTHGMLVNTARQGGRQARTAVSTAARSTAYRQSLNRKIQGSDIQSRGYRASVAPQGSSWFSGSKTMYGPQPKGLVESVFSWFTPMTPERFVEEFKEQVFGVIPNNMTNIPSLNLDDAALKRVKNCVIKNNQFINAQFQVSLYELGNAGDFSALFSKYEGQSGTILTWLLNLIMDGWNEPLYRFASKDKELENAITLIKFLIDNGATITEENKQSLINIYQIRLMEQYRTLRVNLYPYHLPNSSDQATEYRQKMDNFFENLDPVLERLIPEANKSFKEARKERDAIKNNARQESEAEKHSSENKRYKSSFNYNYGRYNADKDDNDTFTPEESSKFFTTLREYSSLSIEPTVQEVTQAWRTALKQIHPDYASDEADAKQRNEKTQELNRLYRGYRNGMRKASAKKASTYQSTDE